MIARSFIITMQPIGTLVKNVKDNWSITFFVPPRHFVHGFSLFRFREMGFDQQSGLSRPRPDTRSWSVFSITISLLATASLDVMLLILSHGHWSEGVKKHIKYLHLVNCTSHQTLAHQWTQAGMMMMKLTQEEI